MECTDVGQNKGITVNIVACAGAHELFLFLNVHIRMVHGEDIVTVGLCPPCAVLQGTLGAEIFAAFTAGLSKGEVKVFRQERQVKQRNKEMGSLTRNQRTQIHRNFRSNAFTLSVFEIGLCHRAGQGCHDIGQRGAAVPLEEGLHLCERERNFGYQFSGIQRFLRLLNLE